MKTIRDLDYNKTGGQNIVSQRYDFDTALVTDSDEKPQFQIERLVGARELEELKFNPKN